MQRNLQKYGLLIKEMQKSMACIFIMNFISQRRIFILSIQTNQFLVGTDKNRMGEIVALSFQLEQIGYKSNFYILRDKNKEDKK